MKNKETRIAALAGHSQLGIKFRKRAIGTVSTALLLVCISITPAAQAEGLKGGICTTSQSRVTGADHVWHCEHLGRVTIRQIYEKGFRVVSAYSSDPAEKTSQFQYLIIEEQGK